MENCKTCGELVFWPNGHLCDPAWEVLDWCGKPEDKVFAVDAEEAAEKAAQRDLEYSGEHADEVEFSIRPIGSDGPWTKFVVSVEYEPVFHATEVTDDE